jgi:hypothetical protein
VLVTLIIAGTGVYTLGRVLRLSVLASIFAGTVFELSGPMLAWLGWPHAAVLSWAGWLFAAAILVVRGPHRVRYIALLSLVIAAMIYAGQPEILVLLGLGFVVFSALFLTLRAPLLGGSGPMRRPVFDLLIAIVAGGALGAPLLLPGLQLISGSQRGAAGGDPAELVSGNPPLPLHNLIHVIFQGFDGLPIAGNRWFGYSLGFDETAVYVGVVALVLAVLAVAVDRRRPEVVAFGALTLAMVAIAFVPPLVSFLSSLPLVGPVLWQRALLPLAFGLAMLAGFGTDVIVRANEQRAVRNWAGGGFVMAALLLVTLWAFGRGNLPAQEDAIRARSFIWPAFETLVGLGVIGALILVHRRAGADRPDNRPWRASAGRWAGMVLLAGETAFLVAAGAPIWTSTSTPFATTTAESALKRAVGSSVVGFGAPLCLLPPGLGIPQNAQDAYEVHELALYDPAIPRSYFSSWTALTGRPGGFPKISIYCPGVTTVALARLYGVGFILEQAGTPGPKGSVFDTSMGGEDLYRIPGAAVATLTPVPTTGLPPAIDAVGTPVAVTHPDPASWRLVTDTARAQVLRLRLTDVPGWHASIDGRSVALHHFAGVMLELEVPPGHHTVVLNYWPDSFTVGIVLAVCALVGLLAALVIDERRLRRYATLSSARRPNRTVGARRAGGVP